MKYLLVLWTTILLSIRACAQTPVYRETLYDWNVDNTTTNTGERVIVTIDVSSLNYVNGSRFAGMSLAGQVIDNNSNWGDALPTVSNFRMFARIDTPMRYSIVQDMQTPNIQLRLRQINDSRFALTALLPTAYIGARVVFRYTEGLIAPITMTDPNNLTPPTGSLVIAQPNYLASFTGKVGIGTNTPQEELSVNGTLLAKKIQVASSNWPDYVFDSAYSLTPLDQLRCYIRQNHHLPDMPTAEDVAAHGLDLATANRLLTQKTEELTLYLVAARCRQQALQQTLDAQWEAQQNKERRLEALRLRLVQQLDSLDNTLH